MGNIINIGDALLRILDDNSILISNPSLIRNVYKSLTGHLLNQESLMALRERENNTKNSEG